MNQTNLLRKSESVKKVTAPKSKFLLGFKYEQKFHFFGYTNFTVDASSFTTNTSNIWFFVLKLKMGFMLTPLYIYGFKIASIIIASDLSSGLTDRGWSGCRLKRDRCYIVISYNALIYLWRILHWSFLSLSKQYSYDLKLLLVLNIPVLVDQNIYFLDYF